MGNLCFLVFVIFTYLINFVHIAEETYCNHDSSHSKKDIETCESFSKEAVVFPQKRPGSFATHQIAQDLCGSEESSLTRRTISCRNCESNVGQCTVALWRVPSAAQAHGNILSNLSTALAEHYRPHLCTYISLEADRTMPPTGTTIRLVGEVNKAIRIGAERDQRAGHRHQRAAGPKVLNQEVRGKGKAKVLHSLCRHLRCLHQLLHGPTSTCRICRTHR